MAITRKDLLQELLPGLNALFGIEYDINKTRLDAEQYTVEVKFDEQNTCLVVLEH
jgi:hypothetical protein